MSEASEFPQLVQRVRGGDGAAAAELVRRYEPAIRRSARLRLDPRLRRVCDSMDICQAVLGSFFIRAASGQYDLDKPEQLLKLLATMVRNKLTSARRGQRAACRDDRRLEAGNLEEWGATAAGASPSREVAARELLQEAHRLLSAEEQHLVNLRHEGRDWAAIAAELGGTPDALRLKLARALARVAKQLGLDDAVEA
jgi:RNA polymerase sigma-70 factor (ECF subfamily)